jgi:hypothetical protein
MNPPRRDPQHVPAVIHDEANQIDPPLWWWYVLRHVHGSGHCPSKSSLDRLMRILGSLEWDMHRCLPVVPAFEVHPTFASVTVRIGIGPREVEIIVPWFKDHRVFTRMNNQVMENSMIHKPNVRQLREALAWVDKEYLKREED